MITLLNAAPDTGNQGVSALCHSMVAGLAARGAQSITVADHGIGLRRAIWNGTPVGLVGLTHTKRLWRGDSLRTAYGMLRLGMARSAPARVVAGSRAVLDISGGDSFTDLYGAKRFQAMILTKRLALAAGVPLVLLPQKLGPFRDPANLAVAVDILRRAQAVWVRDAQSHRFLQDVLGADFDPARHRLGVDVAVALPAQQPQKLDPEVRGWLSHDDGIALAGLNVSGLLCNDAAGAQKTFGLAGSHADQITALAQAILQADPQLRLVLISHVHRPLGDAESDLAAAKALVQRLGPAAQGRVRVIEDPLSAIELKWVLGRLDWFAGARMHATIGAFSSGVPTLGLGYSDKAYGVFAECGIGEEVADLRQMDARALAGRAVASFTRRQAIRSDLVKRVEGLRARAGREMDVIARQAGL
jgi:polysaccharide pyruvyl transferase WcaK-like protein